MSQPDTSTISEADLAAELGIAREKIADLRETLIAGEDFRREKNAFVLTPTGAAKVRLALGAPLDPLLEKKAPPEPATLYVRRRATQNSHLIFATRKKEGDPADEIPVRVRKASEYIAGQEIQALEDSGGLWHLHGRQPRARGARRLSRRP